MAFVKPQTNTDDQTTITGNSSQDQVVTPSINNTSGGVVDTSGTSTAPGTGAAPVGTSVSDNNAQNGKGMFTNLKTYLDKNDTGAANLGDTLSGNINQQTGAANTAVNNAQTDFNNSVSGNTVNYNNDLWNNVANDASEYESNNDVKQGLSGTYTGPTDITGTDAGKTAQSALTDAQTTGLLGQNVEGRTQLLDNIFNNTENTPKTTSGGLGLDQFLIQNTEPAYNKVVDAYTAAGDPLTNTYKGVLDTSLQTVKDARATNLDTRNQALARLGQGQTDLQKQVTDELLAKQTAADKAAADKTAWMGNVLQSIINGGPIDPSQAAGLGLTTDQLNQLNTLGQQNAGLGQYKGNVIGGNYVNQATGGALGTADVITPEQQADLIALGKLQGIDLSSFLKNGTAGNAGGINYGGFQGDLANQIANGTAQKVEAERQAEIARQAEVARQAAEAEQQRQAQAAADAEAARVAQYSQPTGNVWADAANQAYLRGDVASYNYYMLLAQQLTGYQNRMNSVAQRTANYVPGNDAAYMQSLLGGGGGGSGGVGEGGSPTSSATEGVGTGIGNSTAGGIGSAVGAGLGIAGIAAPPGLSSAVAAANAVANAVAAANAGGPGSPGSAGNSGAAAGVGNGTAGSPGGNTGQEGNASNGNGNGGSSGGSGGSCVMATALASSGQWKASQKGELVEWCERKLHGTKFGECLRRGYQVLGAKIGVPAIRGDKFMAKYYKWTFEQITATLTGKSFNLLSLPNTIIWLTAVMITGSIVSTSYANKTWKNLYRNKDES